TPPLHRYGMQMEVIFKVESSAVHSSKQTSTLGRTPGYAKARVVRGSTPSTVLIYFPHSTTARAADWRSPRRSGRRRRRRAGGAGEGGGPDPRRAVVGATSLLRVRADPPWRTDASGGGEQGGIRGA